MPTFIEIESEFVHRLDRCWLSVMVADVAQLSTSTGWPTISRDVRAGAVVMAMAEFEALLKDSVEALNRSVEASGVLVGDLRDGLRFLHMESQVSSAASSSLERSWASRLDLARSVHSPERPALPRRTSRGFLQPLGQETPKPSTLARLWTVYELPGAPFLKFRWRSALGELGEIRNDVAHRRELLKISMSGRSRTADKVAEHILDLRELGNHVVRSIDSYVANGGYKA
jgi:hypothetical protein